MSIYRDGVQSIMKIVQDNTILCSVCLCTCACTSLLMIINPQSPPFTKGISYIIHTSYMSDLAWDHHPNEIRKWPCSLGPYQSQPPRRTTCDQHAPFSFLPVRHPNRTNKTTPSHKISPSIPSFPPPNHHWFNPPPLLTGNEISERYESDSSSWQNGPWGLVG